MSQGLQALCDAQRTNTPEAAIKGACNQLLSLCGLRSAPIPLKPLCKELGISFSWSKKHSYFRPGHGSASLVSRNGALTIYVHEELSRTNWRRIRFSIAHEIIHALIIKMLGDGDLLATLDATKEDHAQLERMCNIGAAELLMPASVIRKSIREYGLSPDGLAALYDQFLVSRETMLWRMGAVLPNSSVIRWRQYARDEGESNCFRVWGCYPPYSTSNGRPWLPKGATTRHIAPNVVERVAENREPIRVDEMTVHVKGRIWKCEGTGTFFPKRSKTEMNPTFEGFLVPDERTTVSSGDILLFASSVS